MKKLNAMLIACLLVMGLFSWEKCLAGSGQPATVTDRDRCAVCGMFVGKYPEWVAQIALSDGRNFMFDGPKDMLVFYFAPEEYGVEGGRVDHLHVKDYYSQRWLDGREAFYVIGSDVYGPMGEEFVPFDSRQAAESFLKDHHGKEILSFEDISPALVQSMRKGHKMKMKMKQ